MAAPSGHVVQTLPRPPVPELRSDSALPGPRHDRPFPNHLAAARLRPKACACVRAGSQYLFQPATILLFPTLKLPRETVPAASEQSSALAKLLWSARETKARAHDVPQPPRSPFA